jgi:hypothetical protein
MLKVAVTVASARTVLLAVEVLLPNQSSLGHATVPWDSAMRQCHVTVPAAVGSVAALLQQHMSSHESARSNLQSKAQGWTACSISMLTINTQVHAHTGSGAEGAAHHTAGWMGGMYCWQRYLVLSY